MRPSAHRARPRTAGVPRRLFPRTTATPDASSSLAPFSPRALVPRPRPASLAPCPGRAARRALPRPAREDGSSLLQPPGASSAVLSSVLRSACLSTVAIEHPPAGLQSVTRLAHVQQGRPDEVPSSSQPPPPPSPAPRPSSTGAVTPFARMSVASPLQFCAAASGSGSSSSRPCGGSHQQRDSPSPLQSDLAAFPSVLDRPFVMGQPSPYRRSSSGSPLDGIAEEAREPTSDDDVGADSRRRTAASSACPSRSLSLSVCPSQVQVLTGCLLDSPAGTEPKRWRFLGLPTPPASPLMSASTLLANLPSLSPSSLASSLPPSPSSPSSITQASLGPPSRGGANPASVLPRTPPRSPARPARSSPSSPPVRTAGRSYGGRKAVIEAGVKDYKSDVVNDPTNVKSPSSSAFWAGLDDDEF